MQSLWYQGTKWDFLYLLRKVITFSFKIGNWIGNWKKKLLPYFRIAILSTFIMFMTQCSYWNSFGSLYMRDCARRKYSVCRSLIDNLHDNIQMPIVACQEKWKAGMYGKKKVSFRRHSFGCQIKFKHIEHLEVTWEVIRSLVKSDFCWRVNVLIESGALCTSGHTSVDLDSDDLLLKGAALCLWETQRPLYLYGR